MAMENGRFRLERTATRHHKKEIKHALDTLSGVHSVSIGSTGQDICVDFDNTGTNGTQIVSKLRAIGLEVTPDATQMRVE